MIIDKEFIEKSLLGVEQEDPSKEHKMAQQRSNAPVLEDYNDNPNDAFHKIECLLSVRDRSVSEVTSRLQRDRYTERAINESIDRALRCGYLDDARFADVFIRSKLRASKGINGIVRDLKQHDIDAYSIPHFPDAYLEEQGSQLENALHLLKRKPPRAKNKQQAAYAKLIRNGFSSSIASAAVRTWLAECEQDVHFA